jgi:excisionase family DNA binding protein
MIDIRQKILCTVNEGAAAISVSRSKAYQLIRSGRIRVVRMDGRTKVVVASLLELAERDTGAAA